jgi:hypothetical protein
LLDFRSLHTHLKNAVRVCALAAFFFTALPLVDMGLAHAKNYLACSERKVALRALFQGGYAYVGTFITEHGIVSQLFLDRHSGRWAWIGVTPKIEYCILMQGAEMSLAVEREG